MHLAKISITEIREPAQVARAVIDEAGIEELAESIKRVGIINPLTVKEIEGGYEVVAGHRRFKAAKLAGLVVVPCLVRSARDANPTAIKLHENLYRQELTPVEEAAFFAELLPECENDTDKLAATVRQTRNYVENRLNLLHGDPDVLAAVAARKISLGVGEELNKMPRPEDRRYYLGWAVTTGATVALVRQWRATLAAQAQGIPEPLPAADPSQAPKVEGRDVLQCFLCGDREPVTDLEFWHIHRGCRVRAERAVAMREEAARAAAGSVNSDDHN